MSRGILWREYCLWGVSYFYSSNTCALKALQMQIVKDWQEGSIATLMLPPVWNTSSSSLPAGSKRLFTLCYSFIRSESDVFSFPFPFSVQVTAARFVRRNTTSVNRTRVSTAGSV